MKAKFLNESRRYSIKKIVDDKLEPLANKLNLPLVKGKRKVEPHGYGAKRTDQTYRIGDISILIVDIKVPGMGADNPDIFVLDSNDPTKGVKVRGWSYDNLEELVLKEMEEVNEKPMGPHAPSPWNEKKLQELINDLRSDMSSEGIGDNEAFDIADSILKEPEFEGLAEYLEKTRNITEPLGWLADRIV